MKNININVEKLECSVKHYFEDGFNYALEYGYWTNGYDGIPDNDKLILVVDVQRNCYLMKFKFGVGYINDIITIKDDDVLCWMYVPMIPYYTDDGYEYYEDDELFEELNRKEDDCEEDEE
jgi:hypothetical protein